jgi:hypothetical protein
MIRVCIIAECVPLADVAILPGVVTICVDRLSDGLAAIRARECDCVLTPETVGTASSVSCLDVARVARGYGVGCVIVTEHDCDGPHGAVCMPPGGDFASAVERAMVARGR